MNRKIRSFYELPDRHKEALMNYLGDNPQIKECKLIGSFYSGTWHDEFTDENYKKRKEKRYNSRGKTFKEFSDIDILIKGERKSIANVGIIDVFTTRSYDIEKGVEIFKKRKFL